MQNNNAFLDVFECAETELHNCSEEEWLKFYQSIAKHEKQNVTNEKTRGETIAYDDIHDLKSEFKGTNIIKKIGLMLYETLDRDCWFLDTSCKRRNVCRFLSTFLSVLITSIISGCTFLFAPSTYALWSGIAILCTGALITFLINKYLLHILDGFAYRQLRKYQNWLFCEKQISMHFDVYL